VIFHVVIVPLGGKGIGEDSSDFGCGEEEVGAGGSDEGKIEFHVGADGGILSEENERLAVAGIAIIKQSSQNEDASGGDTNAPTQANPVTTTAGK